MRPYILTIGSCVSSECTSHNFLKFVTVYFAKVILKSNFDLGYNYYEVVLTCEMSQVVHRTSTNCSNSFCYDFTHVIKIQLLYTINVLNM